MSGSEEIKRQFEALNERLDGFEERLVELESKLDADPADAERRRSTNTADPQTSKQTAVPTESKPIVEMLPDYMPSSAGRASAMPPHPAPSGSLPPLPLTPAALAPPDAPIESRESRAAQSFRRLREHQAGEPLPPIAGDARWMPAGEPKQPIPEAPTAARDKTQSPSAIPIPQAPVEAPRPRELTDFVSLAALRKMRPVEREKSSLELQIGMRWMAWAGALVVILAVGFFVKLAVDLGWWGHMPPLTKCSIAAAFGGLLLIGGEIALRRIGRTAAVSLFSAGLGTLYLTAYASFHNFHLTNETGAFVLLMIVALLGFGITVRGKMLTTGVLAVLGGYLTPVLLDEASSFPAALPLYITMLLAVSLGLSAWMPRPCRPLRYVAMASHGLVGLAWAATDGRTHWMLTITFMGLWWAMVTAEVAYAAIRRQSSTGNAVASMLATAWFVTVGCWILGTNPAVGRDWLGLKTASVAMLSAIAALLICPGFAVLRSAPTNAAEKLAVTLWAEFGVLVTVAIALQFDGYGQSVGWLAIALACVEIGRRLRSTGVDKFGLVVGVLAILRVALVDPYAVSGMRTAIWTWGDLSVSRWAILALFAVAATKIAAHRLRSDELRPRPKLPIVLSGLAIVGWMGICAVQGQNLVVTGGWLVAATALIALERFGPRLRYLESGFLVLLASAARWLVADATLARIRPGWDSSAVLPFVNWQMAMGVAIAAVGWWASRKLLRRELTPEVGGDGIAAEPGMRSNLWQVALLIVAGFFLVALSFEIDRSVVRLAVAGRTFGFVESQLRQLLFTLLWASSAAGLAWFAALLVRRSPGRISSDNLIGRIASIVVLVCGVKWVCFDTILPGLMRTAQSGLATVAADAWPLANLQMLVGIVVAGSFLLLYKISSDSGSPILGLPESSRKPMGGWIAVCACLVIMWGLSFEVVRLITQFEARPDWNAVWSRSQLRALWLMVLWAAGGAAMFAFGIIRSKTMKASLAPVDSSHMMALFTADAMRRAGLGLMFACALVWLVVDTVGFRVSAGVVRTTPVINLQFAAGCFLVGTMVLAAWKERMRSREVGGPNVADEMSEWVSRGATATQIALALIVAIGLWLGSFEIDRFCATTERFAEAAMARRAGMSIYWGVYGIMLVAAGFIWRMSWCRYAGLALLALTLAKVMTVDMAEVKSIYRVASLLAVGLLLMATSIAYAKLASRLLAQPDANKGEAT